MQPAGALIRWLDAPVPASLPAGPAGRRHFRMMLGVGLYSALVHALLVPAFLLLGSKRLALFNVGSTLLFATSTLAFRRDGRSLWIVIWLAEILGHAWFASWEYGWHAQFHLYFLFPTLALGTVPGWGLRVSLGLASFSAWAAGWLALHELPPQTALPTEWLPILAGANFLVAAGSLGASTALLSRAANRAEAEAERQRDRARQLLLDTLPAPIVGRLEAGESTIADRCEDVTVLFSDLVGFTRLSAGMPADELVMMLNDIFSRIDEAADALGLEKIKTIGDAYMVASGVPEPSTDHVMRMAMFGVQICRLVEGLTLPGGAQLQMRIGIHTGPVVAGVIGQNKLAYDLWGDTVNTASRMESHGVPGRVHVSAAVADRLRGHFGLEPRGVIEVKGKGPMETFFLLPPETVPAAERKPLP